MRKNTTMRLAAILLALTLITTCFVGGTFAKYTTSVSVNDQARVAYWGFQQAAITEFELFNPNDEGILSNGYIGSDPKTGLLAPGSSATASFSFAYNKNAADNVTAPEVDYNFTVSVVATDRAGNAADVDSLDANPNFKWTLQKKVGTNPATDVGAGTFATFELLQKEIMKLSGNTADDTDGIKRYEAGELPAAFTEEDETYIIGWSWAFEADGDADAIALQDKTDTAMGNDADLDDIKIVITVTATQLDA